MNPFRFLVATSFLAISLGAPALAQDQRHDDVHKLVAASAKPDQKPIAIQVFEVMLYGYGESVFSVDPAKRYHVYAACDANCGDIALELHDAGEIVVAVADGSRPALTVERNQSGEELHVVVSLGNCVTDICVVGYGLYEAP
jgi:hypothetical protein